ncbi:MAG TPA: hypothetical protein VMV10_12710 [Pirellulales bacterium]|nr:hypothetical protein [Pirellulales bacterium]
MKKLAYLVAAAAMLLAARAEAQQPRRASSRTAPVGSEKPAVSETLDAAHSMAQMTPEMWFYQQEMRRYEDPRAAVRRKAEFRAAQRQRRIAAMDWYGFSNSRPLANPTPFSGGVYAPGWISNNNRHPMQWSGGGRTVNYGVIPISPWVAGYR